jgi:hypothetical protein
MCACCNKAIRIGSYGSTLYQTHAFNYTSSEKCMHGNIYVAISPHRYKGIYIVYMADVYEGRHIGSIMRQVFTQPVK